MVSESPLVARRRLRLALRKAREAKGLTQGQVAESLYWSLSKVNRIEAGDVTVSTTDLKALLDLYNVTDEAVVRQLVADAQAARRRGWWHDETAKDHLTPDLVKLLQYESEATMIRIYQPSLVPGILQTPSYARSIFESGPPLTPEERAARLDIRLRRRTHVFDRPNPPIVLILLDESVLLRERGGDLVMYEQMKELAAYNERPNVITRITPLRGGTMSLLGAFMILDIDDESAILYQEIGFSDQISEVPGVVRRYREAFDHVWESSLDEMASASLIQARVAVLMAALDQHPQPPQRRENGATEKP
ncbi:MAG TPA: helix-turn-helix transcriptional regulator [Micromonosporaceae bacterium]|nr:helix-turn-helix transcriptional regulator [Micromonosporaceae bacterium]